MRTGSKLEDIVQDMKGLGFRIEGTACPLDRSVLSPVREQSVKVRIILQVGSRKQHHTQTMHYSAPHYFPIK